MRAKLIGILMLLFIQVIFGNQVHAQKKGVKKAEFLEDKVIITEGITENGKTETNTTASPTTRASLAQISGFSHLDAFNII